MQARRLRYNAGKMPRLLKNSPQRTLRTPSSEENSFFLCVLRVLCSKNSTASACGPLDANGFEIGGDVDVPTITCADFVGKTRTRHTFTVHKKDFLGWMLKAL